MTTPPIYLSGYHIVEQLYAGSRTLVYRGIQEQTQRSVVVKLLKQEHPSFSELVQFRNQYTIAKNLNITDIIQPYSLESYRNGYALVMEDFGGVSLRQFTQGRSLPVEQFFAIALQLSDILHQLHQQRVIHKDIKPANILIHPDTKQVKLIDFSIASLLPREIQEVQSPGGLEGTLAYLSPEQSGRMNRGIDYRSDFYSLGITCFELLSGQLPFSSPEPMELVHCHLAKQPPSLCDLNPELPLMLGELIRKLMAKNAEDRYQSTIGLKHDLLKCQQVWQSPEQHGWFELGQRDVCDRFLIPEKLYGREAEVQVLLEAFGRVANGASELMLVAGFSGIGKTAVVNEVHKPIVRWNGYFIKGKYDQFQRNIPLSAFVQAFRDLIGQLLSESDTQLTVWRTQILDAMGENGQVITAVIPELEQMIGEQPPVPELSGNAAQNRFNLVFQKFIQVFTTAAHPLVIFLDDLQWADSTSLNLIKLLMGENNQGYLFIIGAYRDNEVFPAHPLMLTLEEIEKTAILNTITLAPLNQADINQLIADTLNCAIDRPLPLTELVYQKTKGNPFFTTQFLKALYEDGLITFNWQAGSWQCDVAQVRSLSLTDDVVEFMAGQLLKLPPETQTVLKLAACIGAQFDLSTLAIVSEQSQTEAATALWKALQEGLILPISETYKFFQAADLETSAREIAVSYKFLHDRVQQAAYSLIPDEQKQATHYSIGKLLLQNTSETKLEASIFEIVNHLNTAIDLVKNNSEKEKLTRLNLAAGRKAKASSAYTQALRYLETGLRLLPEDSWLHHYTLSLTLHVETAEAALLNTYFDQAQQLIERIVKFAENLLDKVKAYEIQIQGYIAQGKLLEALQVGQQVLQSLGVTLPNSQSSDVLQQELEKIAAQYAEKSIESLIHLPQMTAPEQIAAMRVLAKLWSPAFLAHPSLVPLIVLKQVELSLQYGHTSESTFAYAGYAVTLISIVGDIEAGYRFGQLALNLLEHLSFKENKARTEVVVNNHIIPWKQHLRITLAPLLKAYQTGLETGDLEFASYAAILYCYHSCFIGNDLLVLEQDMRAFTNKIEQLKQSSGLDHLKLHHQTVLNLLGQSGSPIRLVGEAFDETEVSLFESKNQSTICVWYFNKLILAYLFEARTEAIVEADGTLKYLNAVAGLPYVPIFHFYDSLARLRVLPDVAPSTQKLILEKVPANQTKLKTWAYHAPMNFQHKYDLVEAERYRVSGNKMEAIDLYDRAIAGARANGYIQEEALANELAAKFYLSWGKERIAQEYLTEAYYGYARWGAKAKVIDLESRYPQLLAPILQQTAAPLSPTETIVATQMAITSSSGSSSASMALDLASILKVSQALSSEIELDKLIATLLHVVIETAGADRAILLLSESGELMLRAIAELDQDTTLLSPQPFATSSELPISLINSVKRSLQPAIIVNATMHPQFAKDVYIQHCQPKSLLCSPILQQGKLLGVLYLENRLTMGAFTRDRVELLNLLCAQAAISLENARLYQQSLAYSQQLENSLESLQMSETRFQNLAANVPGMIYQFCLAADGTPSTPYVSSGCLDLYELEPELVMAGKHSLYAMHHPNDHATVEQAVITSAETLTPFTHEWRIITPSGKVKWIQSAARPERKADDSIVWDGVVIDVSDRKQAEAERQQVATALRHSEERYRCLMATTSPIVWISAPDGLNVDSPLWCAYTGQSLDALKNFEWLQAIHPEDQEHTGQVWNHARETKTWYKTEYRIRAKDGTYRYFDVKGVPILDEEGSIREWFGICTDINDRKRAEAELNQRTVELEQTLAELQRTQAQMVQAEKMSGLGQLVAGVAHEINNPVNFIFGNLTHANSYTNDILELLELYQRHYPSPHPEVTAKIEAIDLDFLLEDLPKILVSMRVGAERIQRIVASLRTFSRMDEAEVKAVDVHDGIDSTLMILQHRLKAKPDHPGIEVNKDYGNLPLVECYAGQLNQVFMNVLSNAIDALAEKLQNNALRHAIDALENTQEHQPDFQPTITIRTVRSGRDRVQICITDNGPGIPGSIKSKLFDPFFTTKPVGKGTGMGLSISHQIVTEKHRGALQCRSTPGQGTEFIIEIPLSSSYQRVGGS